MEINWLAVLIFGALSFFPIAALVDPELRKFP